MSVFTTLLSLAVAAMLYNLALATEYTVGDRGGWDTTTNLQVWASSNIFLAGDDLSKHYEPTYTMHIHMHPHKHAYVIYATMHNISMHLFLRNLGRY